jgi:tellurite resistance protein TehA-like permease
VNTPKIYTALLFIPVIGFFIPNERINEYAYFLVVLALIVVAYLCYLFNFQSNVLNLIRKYLACLCTAALVLILSAQLSDILINVYNTDYGEEISFAVKMILMLSNMEGNLELCT